MVALDRLFYFSAIGGGALFVIQLVLLFATGGSSSSLEADLDLDGDLGHAAADASFKVLSLQGITAFVMMFGLTGWAMRADSAAGPLVSLGVAVAAGSASTWLIGRIFVTFHRLQSTGNLKMTRAVGAVGEVYLKVSPGKPGKVTVTVGNRQLTLEAIVEGEHSLETGTPIIVKRVISDTTVSVEKN